MATVYKRTADAVMALQARLGGLQQCPPGASASDWKAALDDISKEMAGLQPGVAKMRAKAEEQDPDRKVYNAAMVAKVNLLVDQYEGVRETLELLLRHVGPQAAEEAAEKQRRSEADAEARQKAAEAAAAAEQEAKLAAERREQEAADAKAKAESEAKEKAERERRALLARQQAQEAERLAEETRRSQAARAADLEAQRLAAEARAAEEARRAEEARKAAEEEASRKEAANAGNRKRADDALAGHVTAVTRGEAQLAEVLTDAGSSRLVVVDFSASWCGPCRAMEPVLQGWSSQHAPTVWFLKVDCEATAPNQALAHAKGISAFPTFHLYSGGRMVQLIRGADRGALQRAIVTHSANLAKEDAGESMQQRLMAALLALKQRNGHEGFMAAARTLVTFASNVVAHPTEPKYRRVKAANQRYRSQLGSRPGGAECMWALGFKPIMEAGEEVLVMDEVPAELPRIKAMLDAALGAPGGGAAASTASAPSTAAAVAPAAPRPAAIAQTAPAAAAGPPAALVPPLTASAAAAPLSGAPIASPAVAATPSGPVGTGAQPAVAASGGAGATATAPPAAGSGGAANAPPVSAQQLSAVLAAMLRAGAGQNGGSDTAASAGSAAHGSATGVSSAPPPGGSGAATGGAAAEELSEDELLARAMQESMDEHQDEHQT